MIMQREDRVSKKIYLLDTNVLSTVIKNPSGKIAMRLRKTPKESLVTSIIVSCELLFGAEKKGSREMLQRVQAILETLPILSIGSGCDHIYAKTRAQMERHGHGISANDLLIACQAIQIRATLVTENFRELSRVPNLKVESWG